MTIENKLDVDAVLSEIIEDHDAFQKIMISIFRIILNLSK